MSDGDTLGGPHVPCTYIRRDPRVLAIALATTVFGAIGTAAFCAVDPYAHGSGTHVWACVFGAALLCVGLSVALTEALEKRRASPSVAQVVRGDLLLDGRVVARRTSLYAGEVIPLSEGGAEVRVQRRFRPAIVLRVAGSAEGFAILDGLAIGPAQRLTMHDLAEPSARDLRELAAHGFVIAGLFGAFLVPVPIVVAAWTASWERSAISDLGIVAGWAVISFTLAFLVQRVAGPRLIVGSDAVARRWAWRTEIVPYRDVAAVSEYQETDASGARARGLRLSLRGGGELRWPVFVDERRAPSGCHASAIVARVAAAHARQRCDEQTAAPPMLHAQDGRDVRAWITALRAAGSGAAADLRTAPPRLDELWRLVEHGAAPVEARAAAAVALQKAGDPSGARLLSLASTTVDPDLHMVLAAAAREDDGALMKALGAILARRCGAT
ncbi:Hypothetical protein A7982_04018 [Minicystis rosea]|nr:Hypothetical protein A7982_04018 [Minicystis rosea]